MLAFLTKLTIDPQGLKEKIVDLYEDGFMTSIMLAGSSFLPGKVSRVLVRPGIFPDYEAPVVRNAPDGTRAVHGALGNAVPSSVRRRAGHEHRNTKSPHWRRWLGEPLPCPMDELCEYADTKPKKTLTWFAFSEDRPLAFFVGLWTT